MSDIHRLEPPHEAFGRILGLIEAAGIALRKHDESELADRLDEAVAVYTQPMFIAPPGTIIES